MLEALFQGLLALLQRVRLYRAQQRHEHQPSHQIAQQHRQEVRLKPLPRVSGAPNPTPMKSSAAEMTTWLKCPAAMRNPMIQMTNNRGPCPLAEAAK